MANKPAFIGSRFASQVNALIPACRKAGTTGARFLNLEQAIMRAVKTYSTRVGTLNGTVIRAKSHACNGHGNAHGIQDALTTCSLCLMVKGATHTDPEWPTDSLAEAVCGKSSGARRALFVRYATAALRAELLADSQAKAVLDAAEHDAGVRLLSRQ